MSSRTASVFGPEEEWEVVIMAALFEAQLVLVFWCAHADVSV